MAKKKDKKQRGKRIRKAEKTDGKGKTSARVAALEARVDTLETQLQALAGAVDEALRAG